MDIEIPPWLHWVSYLVTADDWPGSESGCRRDRDHLYEAAAGLLDLVPALNTVRAETLSVLVGETAEAADEHFAMLFDGDYAVDKLADAVKALGESVGDMGDVIEALKIAIVIGLTWAAAEIGYHLARAPATGGASLAAIPPTEAIARMTITQRVAAAMGRIAGKLADVTSRTTVRRLAPLSRATALREIPDELAWALSEKVATDAAQASRGLRPNFTVQAYALTTVAAGAGGAAGGGSSVPTRYVVGDANTQLGRTGKGMLTMGISGVVGSGAGALAVLPATGEFDPQSVLAGAALTSVGGVKGVGGVGGTHAGPNFTHPAGLPPSGPLPPVGPEGNGGWGPRGGEGAHMPTDGRVPETAPPRDGGWAPRGGDGADMPTGQPLTNTAPPVNDVAAQQVPQKASEPPITNHNVATDDEAAQAGPPTPPSDADDPSTPPSEGATLTSDHIVDQGNGQDPIPGTAVAGAPDPGIENEPTSADDIPVGTDVPPDEPFQPNAATPPESAVEAAADRSATLTPDTPSVVNEAGPPPANATMPPSAVSPTTSTQNPQPTQTPQTPQPSAPQTPSAPPKTPSALPNAATTVPPEAPKQDAPEVVSAPPTASPSATAAAPAPAAQLSDTTAARAEPSAEAAAPQPVAPVVDNQSSQSPTDRTQPPVGVAIQPNAPNCGVGAVRFLGRWHERLFSLGVEPTSKGLLARAIYKALNSRSDFTTFADAADGMLVGPDAKLRESAVLTWSWAGDGGRRGGHTAALIKDGDTVYLYDPHTDQYYEYDQKTRQFVGYWGQDAVSQMAVGYLNADGDAVKSLNDTPGELDAADEIGYVQGHPDAARPGPTNRQLADAALDRRVPSLWGKGLVTATGRMDTAVAARGLVNPLGQLDEAVGRAQANALWWKNLTGKIGTQMRDALIETYPIQIGNSWGITPQDADRANRDALKQAQARADQLRSSGTQANPWATQIRGAGGPNSGRAGRRGRGRRGRWPRSSPVAGVQRHGVRRQRIRRDQLRRRPVPGAKRVVGARQKADRQTRQETRTPGAKPVSLEGTR